MKKKTIIFWKQAVLCTAVFVFFAWLLYCGLGLKKHYADFVLLTQAVEELDRGFSGEINFLVKDLALFTRVSALNEDEPVAAASLLKVPIMAAAMQAAKQGKISLSRKVTISRKDITGGSGIIKGMKLPAKLTWSELLKIMITRSDNTATNKVISELGLDYINDCFHDLGLEQTGLQRKMMDFSLRKKGVENYTTASEIGFLLEKIARKELISRQFSELMLAWLKAQTINNRLPRYLPENVEVAHKTGLEKGVVHDAGIVFCDKGSYVICVLTNGVRNNSRAKNIIARASLLAYRMYRGEL